MKLIKKAYTINSSNLLEPWHAFDGIYYGTRGQAKQRALVDNYNLETKYDGELSFLNIKVKRLKNYDVYLHNGLELTKSQIDYQNKVKERDDEFDKLLKNNPNGKAYIMKGGLYWRPERSGYTEIKHVAGVYDLKEAISICKTSSLSRFERPILIDKVKHNKMINDLIEDLKTRLL